MSTNQIDHIARLRRWIRPNVALALDAAYIRLRDRPGQSRATAGRARRAGYMTPREWDAWGGIDSDDPPTLDPRTVIDEVAISRVLDHGADIKTLHLHEQIELFARLRGQGLDDGQIRYRLGLFVNTTAKLARLADADRAGVVSPPS